MDSWPTLSLESIGMKNRIAVYILLRGQSDSREKEEENALFHSVRVLRKLGGRVIICNHCGCLGMTSVVIQKWTVNTSPPGSERSQEALDVSKTMTSCSSLLSWLGF